MQQIKKGDKITTELLTEADGEEQEQAPLKQAVLNAKCQGLCLQKMWQLQGIALKRPLMERIKAALECSKQDCQCFNRRWLALRLP